MASARERDRDRLMNDNGWRLLLIGGLLAAIGFVVMLMVDERGWGVAIMSLAGVPTLAGAGLVISQRVARRAGEGKPFS